MSGSGPEQIVVERPRRHRWARREIWFLVAALAAIALVALASLHKPAQHVAPGHPYGTVPTPTPVVPATATGAAVKPTA